MDNAEAAKFEQDYFSRRNYAAKELLVGAHVLAVLRWASDALGMDLLSGAGKRALDVGCALGFTSRVLCGLGYEVVGLDISKWGASQAKKACAADFLVCDAQQSMPFQDGTFDLVTCFEVLEHLPAPQKALAAMFSAAKGTMVCSTPNKKVEKTIRKLMRDYDQTHINTKTPQEWHTSAASLGGSAFEVEAFHDLTVRLGGKLFFKSFRIPSFGLTIRIVVKKEP
jgi:2-polyprenyl-3-methyl-5-hydroxy-6-metoxy-1,4-benzoquinol methylase